MSFTNLEGFEEEEENEKEKKEKKINANKKQELTTISRFLPLH